jgi:hypothetical protein
LDAASQQQQQQQQQQNDNILSNSLLQHLSSLAFPSCAIDKQQMQQLKQQRLRNRTLSDGFGSGNEGKMSGEKDCQLDYRMSDDEEAIPWDGTEPMANSDEDTGLSMAPAGMSSYELAPRLDACIVEGIAFTEPLVIDLPPRLPFNYKPESGEYLRKLEQVRLEKRQRDEKISRSPFSIENQQEQQQILSNLSIMNSPREEIARQKVVE